MLLKIICQILIKIISFIISLIALISPNMEFLEYFAKFLLLIDDVLEVSINCLYFLIGNAVQPFIVFSITMLGYRYLIYPIIVIIRRIFIKGGDT